MRRTRSLLEVAGVLVAFGSATAVRAQESAPSFRFTELPAAWGSVTGGTSIVDGERLNGGEALGVRVALGYRLARWGALELDGLSSQVIARRTHHISCTNAAYPLPACGVDYCVAADAARGARASVGGGYRSCFENDAVDHVGGVSLGVDLLGRSIADAPRVISVDIGEYQITGGRHGTYGTGPAVSTRAFGITVGLEQIIARGPEAALSLRLAPLILPNVHHGWYWSLPLGIDFWGW